MRQAFRHRDDLRVGQYVFIYRPAVISSRDDPSVINDHAADGHFLKRSRLFRLPDRFFHIVFFYRHLSHMFLQFLSLYLLPLIVPYF